MVEHVRNAKLFQITLEVFTFTKTYLLTIPLFLCQICRFAVYAYFPVGEIGSMVYVS